jgi:hypothetical protein
MVRKPPIHEAIVDKWMGRANPSSAAELVDLLEIGIDRTWQRAQRTLGDVTLGAIVDRVLYTATERFSFLAPLQIREGHIDFEGLRKSSETIAPGELASATRFVMLEFLTVLGHLTAEILTPALHAELGKVRATKRRTPSRRKNDVTS